MCTGFVAQERASGALIGCAFASFMAAEAALPPPWPTSKPARFYMSNLAVLPSTAGVALRWRCCRPASCLVSFLPTARGGVMA